MSERINVCLCFDDGYFFYGLTTIKSLIQNNKNHFLSIYIITDTLKNTNITILNKLRSDNVDIIIKFIDTTILQHLKIIPHLKIYAYYRLMIGSILTNLKKVLYLDSDILVLGDIKTLWNYSIANNDILGAVSDTWVMEKYGDSFVDNELGLLNYFNSGVLLIDLEKWNKGDIMNKVISFISDYPEKIRYADQCGLNVVLSNKWTSLPIQYNFGGTDFNFGDVVIRHFNGMKPWRLGYIFTMTDDLKHRAGRDFIKYYRYFAGNKLILLPHLLCWCLVNFLNRIGLYKCIILIKRKIIINIISFIKNMNQIKLK